MQTKIVLVALILVAVLIGVALTLNRKAFSSPDLIPGSNVRITDGRQIVEIRARGGYQPRQSLAKAGLPTILRFNTNGTFDCSSSVRIPALNISQLLPQAGSTDIDIGVGQLGTLQGSCGMGMYPFEIVFQA